MIRGKLAGTRVPRASTSLPKYLRRPLREPRLAKAEAACFRKQGELANAMELYRCPFHGEVDPGLEKWKSSKSTKRKGHPLHEFESTHEIKDRSIKDV